MSSRDQAASAVQRGAVRDGQDGVPGDRDQRADLAVAGRQDLFGQGDVREFTVEFRQAAHAGVVAAVVGGLTAGMPIGAIIEAFNDGLGGGAFAHRQQLAQAFVLAFEFVQARYAMRARR